MLGVTHAATAAQKPAERRMIMRLLDYWQGLCEDRNCPEIEDFDLDSIGELKPHLFILQFEPDDIHPTVAYLGEALVEDCGRDIAGLALAEAPRHTLLTQVSDHYLQVLAHKAPIAFEAEFADGGGNDILYRSIMLPFGGEDGTINAIVGAISGKTKSAEPVYPHIVGEGRAAAATGPFAVVTSLRESLEECRGLAQAVDAADTRSRQALYRALEAAYGFFFECVAEPEAYADLLSAAGIKRQARAPFTPIVKLIFGADYDKTRLSEYAAALSHARRKNQIAITVRSFFEGHDGGLKGCVRAERVARRTERGENRAAIDEAIQVLRGLPPLTRIAAGDSAGGAAPDDDGDDGGEFVLAIGRRGPDGMVEILRLLDEKPGVVEPIVKRAARAVAAARTGDTGAQTGNGGGTDPVQTTGKGRDTGGNGAG